jgi:hypothetical protein
MGIEKRISTKITTKSSIKYFYMVSHPWLNAPLYEGSIETLTGISGVCCSVITLGFKRFYSIENCICHASDRYLFYLAKIVDSYADFTYTKIIIPSRPCLGSFNIFFIFPCNKIIPIRL